MVVARAAWKFGYDGGMDAAEPRKCRWFHVTPDRLVIGLLVVECLLWFSERFQWFSFNAHKGWTVLIAVAAVGTATPRADWDGSLD